MSGEEKFIVIVLILLSIFVYHIMVHGTKK